jgi:hypothetical protein
MASIIGTIDRVKRDVPGWLDKALIHEACAAAKHRWRERTLDPVTTLRLFVLQVLHGNAACRALTHLSGLRFSVTAYCKARARLPIDVLGYIAAALIHDARRRTRDFGRWHGHRVFHLDGSGLSMPDEPALQRAFGQPARQSPGCGFPVMHVLWMFDAATGLIVDFVTNRCHTHDLADAAKLHGTLGPGDVIVGDRAFGSYAHLCLVLQANLHAVCRLHQRVITDFRAGRRARGAHPKRDQRGKPRSRFVKKLGPMDQLVEYLKPLKRPMWMSPEDFARLPGAVTLRELRCTVTRRGFRTHEVTLITTLLDPRKYPKAELAELYRARWRVEVNLRHLKQTMRMDVLRCKSVDGVLKELWVYAMVYNRVRLLMLDAARRQGAEPDRVSFVDALDALRYRLPSAAATTTLIVNRLRPGRCEPRVIKRRKDRYTYMTRPRDQLRQELGITRVAA